MKCVSTDIWSAIWAGWKGAEILKSVYNYDLRSPDQKEKCWTDWPDFYQAGRIITIGHRKVGIDDDESLNVFAIFEEFTRAQFKSELKSRVIICRSMLLGDQLSD